MNNPQAAVILLHGATMNGRSWDPVRRLFDSSLQVLAPDLPGHGARRSETFTLQGAIDTVVAAAASVAPAPVILVGDSLGGFTAQAAAASLPPAQLKGLVLGGSSHAFIGLPTVPYLLQATVMRVLLPLLGEQKVVQKKVPRLLREFGFDERDVAAVMDAGVSLGVFPQAVAGLRGTDFHAIVSRIVQPTLFINGDLDKNHIRGEAAYVAAARDATVHRFAGCEHGVSLRRSREFAALVNAFAQRVFATTNA